MGRTKKKRGKQFIDMKNAVTFKLVARSTEDPLFCDPSAPQYVLVEKKSKDVIPIELDDVGVDQKKKSTNLSKDARRAEQAKFGIYFDDDYDYLQHLIDAEEVPTLKGVEIVSKASMVADQEDNVLEDPNQPSTSKGSKPQKNPSLMLPSSLFDSTIREKEALTKRAALPVGPQLDWDPDVVEAMEDDYNFDDPANQIDDDFVSQAMMADGGRVEMDEEEDAYLYDFAYKSAEQLPKNLAANLEEEYEDHGSADDDDLSVCGAAGSGSDYDYEDEARDRFPTVGCNHHQMLELLKKKHIKKYFGLEGVPDEDAGTAHTLASHFTEYSMSSSVLPRSEQLRQLDAQFERLFIREYADEAAIGALDGDEDLEGADEAGLDEGSKELMAAAWEEYSEAKRQHQGAVYEPNEEAVKWIREQFAAKEAELRKKIEKHGAEVMDSSSEDSESSDEYEEIEVADPGRKGDKERFDCESILSTYSTTSYHPRILRDTDRYGNILLGRKSRNHIRFDPRTGMPLGPSAAEDSTIPTSANLAKLQQAEVGTTRTSMSRLSELSLRPKNETPEERRERKKELKDFRAARRAEKKANRVAFAEEKIRMQKAGLNNAVQKKVGVI